MKTYFMRTYGCQQNIRDSEIIESLLKKAGFKKSETWRKADLLVLNTCSVRQASEDKIYGLGKEFVKARVKNPNLKVIVTGCMVDSALGERKRFKFSKLKQRLFGVDEILSKERIEDLPRILSRLGLISRFFLKNDDSENRLLEKDQKQALVNISTGCDNFCSYCVVPYARGKEVSRKEEEILKEINDLADQGIEEIILLGQNVNSWGLSYEKKFKIRMGSDQKLPFADLLRKVHGIEKIKKISFLSSNPFDFTNDLVEALVLPKIDRYLHIAVQSGDNEVLERMNRRHKIEDFVSLVSRIKNKVPEMELGTDLIVGFPGETEEAFEKTVELARQVKFQTAYVAMYSPREGTAASKMEDDIPKEEKKRRYRKLVKVIKENRK